MSTETSVDVSEPCSKQPRIHYASYTQFEAIPFKDDPKIKEVLLQQKVTIKFEEQSPIIEPDTVLSNIIDPTLSPNVVSELNQDDLDSPFLFYDNHLTSGFLNSNSELHSNSNQQDSVDDSRFLDPNLEEHYGLNKPEAIFVKEQNQDLFENECSGYQECEDFDRLGENSENFVHIKQENLEDSNDQISGNGDQKMLYQYLKQENRLEQKGNSCDIKQEKSEDSNGLKQCNDVQKIMYLRTEESLGDSDDDFEQTCSRRKQKIDLKQDTSGMQGKLNPVKSPDSSSDDEFSGIGERNFEDLNIPSSKKTRKKISEVKPRRLNAPDDSVQCYRCNVQNIPRNNLMDHLRKTHNMFKTEASVEVDSYLKSLKVTNEESSLYCELCVEHFPSLIHMSVHIEMKHGVCRWCELRFNPQKDIDHRLKHKFKSSYLYKCKICNEEFISVLDFVSLDHQNKHTLPHNANCCIRMDRVRDFECSYCKFQTKNDKVLKFHMQFHKLSKCTTCKHLYLPSSNHIADVDYQKCLSCSPKLEYLYESSNSSIKLFSCLFCDFKCQDGIKLYDHLISWHQYCVGCCKKYPQNMMEKHGNNCGSFCHYKCGYCRTNFQSSSEFKEHLQNNPKCWHKQENVSIKSDLVVDKILSNTQCPYCLVYIGKVTGTFEEHLKKCHGFKTCSKCSSLIKNSGVCKCCPPKKLGNWEQIDQITRARKDLLNRYLNRYKK